ncbi:MAG: hypothetical protein JXQ90_00760 [Cyclobacteriaceae bacterium]
MKNIFQLSFVLLLLLSGVGVVNAQNGNAVVSEVKIYDEGNGSAKVEIRISGNLAESQTTVGFTVQGNRIPGGSVAGVAQVTTRCFYCPTVLGATIPISAAIKGKNDLVDVGINLGTAAIIIRKGKIKARSFRY